MLQTISESTSTGISTESSSKRRLIKRSKASSLELHVFKFGQYFDSYLATEPGRKEFWSKNKLGLISYAQLGRHILVGGGLICAEHHKPQLLKEFLEFIGRHKLVAAFHNIGDHDLPLFQQHQFQITKWGEEPIIDLGNVTWKGKAFEWIRRQSNYCQRHGLKAYEVLPNELPVDEWYRIRSEMLEVSRESLSQKAQGEMRFFEGRIDTHDIGFRRVFVVRSDQGHGRIEGFVVCTPMRGGAEWATELYRRRLDSVRGTIAYLFQHVIEQLQREGKLSVGFCLEPTLRCSERLPGDSILIHLALNWCHCGFGFLFDFAGLRHFRSRFRPRYENRYVCVTPTTTFGSLVAFARISGLLNVNPIRVAKIIACRFQKRNQRRTLVDLD